MQKAQRTANLNNQDSTFSPIERADDPLIECYCCENYNLRMDEIKSKALAWFVQFAIRADLHKSISSLLQWDDKSVRLRGYPEIYSKARELYGLIRAKHVIDENDLATIGLSIFSFPTLSHFFVAPRSQSFVREATLEDLGAHLLELRQIILDSDELSSLLPKASSREEAFGAIFGKMTRSQIEAEASFPKQNRSTQKLLVVDMGAPVTLLKAQFLAALDRSEKQKSSFGVLVQAWRKYGVLPYIDLNEWSGQDPNIRVRIPIQAELIYELEDSGDGTFLYDKTIRETTEPHADRMLDVQSQQFKALNAAASEEFFATIEYAQYGDKSAANAAAEEALHRWFPRTFPYSIPDLEKAERLLPEHSKQLKSVLAEIDRSGMLSLSVKDRIRDYYHGSNGLAVLEFVKRIGMAPEILFPTHEGSADNEQSGIEESDFEKALAAFEEAADQERRNSQR
jgi:hypothetical protein